MPYNILMRNQEERLFRKLNDLKIVSVSSKRFSISTIEEINGFFLTICHLSSEKI